MRRRRFLETLATIPALPCLSLGLTVSALGQVRARIKPNDPEWPSEASWQQLGRDVGGRLTRVTWPLARCVDAPGSGECGQIFEMLKNSTIWATRWA